MIETSAQELFNKLVNEYSLIGKSGTILFTLSGLEVKIISKDSIGNMIQDWLKEWMTKEQIEFEVNPSSQKFPDIYLNLKDKKKGLLEIKAFDWDRGAGFDLANFESYCKSLEEDAYRIDSDYLVIGYTMKDHDITIKNIWLKKIWELSGGSGPYPIKVQEKKKIIYNLRPVNWYSNRNKFKAFESKEAFLSALNKTRYQYSKTHYENSHWLNNVLANYKEHTGVELNVEL